MKFTKEQKKIAYQKLSYEAQTFADSNDTINTIENVAKTYSLNENEADTLDSEVYLTTIGLQSVEEMVNRLKGQPSGFSSKVDLIIADLKGPLLDKLGKMKEEKRFFLGDSPVAVTGPAVSSNLMTSPTQLKSATDIPAPYNLPTGTALEEKINPFIGSPGDKTNWEQRKQQVADKIVSENKYGKADPYREPIK